MEKKNFKLFFAMVTVIMVVLFGSVFASCSNDDDLLLAGDSQTGLVSSLAQDSVKAVTRSLSDYPSGVYNILTKYKNSYVHYKQGAHGCGPLNYVLCFRAIVRADYPPANYAANIQDKWDDVIDYNHATAQTLDQLQDYFDNNDSGWGYSCYVFKKPWTPSGKDQFIEHMLWYLDNYKKPFVVLNAIYSSSQSAWVGHYYIVWNITWTQNCSTSTIYYTNTTDAVTNNFDTQIKSKNLGTFLTEATHNPSATQYGMLYFQY